MEGDHAAEAGAVGAGLAQPKPWVSFPETMEERAVADEGTVALGLVSNLIIYLAGRGIVPKDEMRELLADVELFFRQSGLDAEAQLVRSLAQPIDEILPDDPEPEP